MHIVECPHCHRTFRVPQAVTAARMRCGGCGRSFVGSSAEAPIPGGTSAPIGQSVVPPPAPPRVRPPRSAPGPVMLVITCVGVAGITVLLAALYWIRTHPTFVEKGPEGTRSLPGRPLDQRPGGTAEGSSGGPGGAVTAGRPGEAVPAASRPISPAEEPQGDPKLLVSAPKLRDAGAVGEMRFVCGSVLSKYTVSLGEVSVTAYVDGLRGPSASYPFIRPGGTILYCLPLYVEDMDESRLKIVAEARQARPGLVVWDIPIQEIRRAGDAASERTVWTGKVRNRADFPVKNIRVVLDYYDDEGVWGGRAEGRLEDRTTLEPGSSGFFRVTTGELSALEVTTSRVLVARAVAEKL